jgi:hypothetical protein
MMALLNFKIKKGNSALKGRLGNNKSFDGHNHLQLGFIGIPEPPQVETVFAQICHP